MAIYTRGGDKGETGLFGGTRVPKSHPRVDAYGCVDELNCALGAARAALPTQAGWRELDTALEHLQSECFTIGALLATPSDKLDKLGPSFELRLPILATARLEREIDAWENELGPLKHFILPGGAPAGAAMHVARAVARRAERAIADLNVKEGVPEGVIAYLNRLSTWLFMAARWANKKQGRLEVPWTGLSKKIPTTAKINPGTHDL